MQSPKAHRRDAIATTTITNELRATKAHKIPKSNPRYLVDEMLLEVLALLIEPNTKPKKPNIALHILNIKPTTNLSAIFVSHYILVKHYIYLLPRQIITLILTK